MSVCFSLSQIHFLPLGPTWNVLHLRISCHPLQFWLSLKLSQSTFKSHGLVNPSRQIYFELNFFFLQRAASSDSLSQTMDSAFWVVLCEGITYKFDQRSFFQLGRNYWIGLFRPAWLCFFSCQKLPWNRLGFEVELEDSMVNFFCWQRWGHAWPWNWRWNAHLFAFLFYFFFSHICSNCQLLWRLFVRTSCRRLKFLQCFAVNKN